jgi:hypothetical protein
MLPRALSNRVGCLEVIDAFIHALTACRALTNAEPDPRVRQRIQIGTIWPIRVDHTKFFKWLLQLTHHHDRSFILFLFFGSQTGAKGVSTPPFSSTHRSPA